MAEFSPLHPSPPAAALGDPTAAANWLERNVVECLPKGGLAQLLAASAKEGRPLRVKLGIDPTAPDIHLGFSVVLGKLREFQELGHTVVLIIGDWTAKVGDPSGRAGSRPQLSSEEIEANADTFAEQAKLVLLDEQLEIRRNGEWLDMPLEKLFEILRTTTVAQVTDRDDISKRLKEGSPVSVLELLYPILQGYDSVAVAADVELGGTDQHFNLLLGRDLQRAFGQPEQIAMELPILTGTDGVKKMSKSIGNYIGVTESPAEIYGKTMSIPDTALEEWCRLLLDVSLDDSIGPRDAKRALAAALVERFHGAGAGLLAQADFDSRFIENELPTDAPAFEFAGDEEGMVHVPALVAAAYGVSRSEARRNIEEGAIRINGERMEGLDHSTDALSGAILQRGKKRDARLLVLGNSSQSA
ncbi:MAG: tyrosine--tRNA ligase [Actinobacteria bacterium]|uniref:tyrosine--tRNA ligase n=1 Tax=freshwater metagenome TaxID=449393 RepID=A0A6J7EBQ5_9ZZZZ|nr:tyrosine--tRNA ligase [Actinomycetota bacterium]